MGDYTHYNDRVNSATVERLLELNRQFYGLRARDFAETRLRIQPGVRRVIQTLMGDETILDLGCGSGTLARALSRVGHRGQYIGIDASKPMLDCARSSTHDFSAGFVLADLAHLPVILPTGSNYQHPEKHASNRPDTRPGSMSQDGWSMITAFSVLHHIPGKELRTELLRRTRELISPRGQLVLSNWQFTSNGRLRERIHAWSSLGVKLEPDPGDYLLDWRRGQHAFRYVHEFDEPQLAQLASESGYTVIETFYSDGEDHRSGLYQRWRPA